LASRRAPLTSEVCHAVAAQPRRRTFPSHFARPTGEPRLGKPASSLAGELCHADLSAEAASVKADARAGCGGGLLTIHLRKLVPYAPSSEPGRFNRSVASPLNPTRPGQHHQ